ncbi:MAG TPA: hypothetical protein VJJ98_01090 [Sedimentisphaerales bacterium]|nr:hypothetical protein [Sedimentisphaerales bacterium]
MKRPVMNPGRSTEALAAIFVWQMLLWCGLWPTGTRLEIWDKE